jgi:ParB-like chromosome segregation protein Spo0J
MLIGDIVAPLKMRIERNVKIARLTRHPRNPREGDIGAISESIKHNDFFTVPVVQDGTDVVLVGWHRVQAAKEAGMTALPAVAFVTADEDRALRIVLADNRTSDLAAYDQVKLAEVLRELAASEPNTEAALVGTGFDGDALDALLRDLGETGGPKDFKELDDDIKTEWRCPKCGYEWSGKQSGGQKLPPV